MYNIADQTFKKSNVKCPRHDEYKAFTMNDKRKNELCTFGFVSCQWIKCGMNDHLYPPQYLIRMILSYYSKE